MRSVVPLALAAFTVTACAADDYEFPGENAEDPMPAWLWLGKPEEAPPCPGGHNSTLDAWSFDNPPGVCGECTCMPAVCKPPSRVVPQGFACAEAGEVPMFGFNADEGWDGRCFGQASSARNFTSIRYEPPTVTPCVPTPPYTPPPMTMEYGRACPVVPEVSRPADFVACIIMDLTLPSNRCPDSFPKLRDFAKYVVDFRTCSPCACTPPSEFQCTARITVHEDFRLNCSQAIDGATLSYTDDPVCHDIGMPETSRFNGLEAKITEPIAGRCTPVKKVSEIEYGFESSPVTRLCCER